jgi:nicotinamide-nucleotide amidase
MKKNIEEDIRDLAKEIISVLQEKNLKISFAESITGGLLASSLTNEENASKVFELGVVAYSNEMKIALLECSETTLENHGVYSIETIKEMLNGLKIKSKADILIATSGVAGPNQNQGFSPGVVFIGISYIDEFYERVKFSGNRQNVRLNTVKYCFNKVLEIIKKEV